MAKEKSLNPVAAHHRSTKRAAINKNKHAVQQAREERLSKRNPARLEKQLAELRDRAESGGGGGGGGGNNAAARQKDQQAIKALERDLALIKRARERNGTAGAWPREDRGEWNGEARVKRRRTSGPGDKSGFGGQSSSEDTDEEVRSIPMPRDTPPPVPRRRRKENLEKDLAPAQVSFSSEAVLRDFKKESTAAKFAPAAVRRNIDKAKGKGGLIEEEEWERLEKAGYAGGTARDDTTGRQDGRQQESPTTSLPGTGRGGPQAAAVEDVEDEDL